MRKIKTIPIDILETYQTTEKETKKCASKSVYVHHGEYEWKRFSTLYFYRI